MTREEADAGLAQAIRNHAEAYELAEDDEMLNDYAVIVHWQRVNDDCRCRYTTHYTSPTVPTHVAVGLFTVGVSLADEGEDE